MRVNRSCRARADAPLRTSPRRRDRRAWSGPAVAVAAVLIGLPATASATVVSTLGGSIAWNIPGQSGSTSQAPTTSLLALNNTVSDTPGGPQSATAHANGDPAAGEFIVGVGLVGNTSASASVTFASTVTNNSNSIMSTDMSYRIHAGQAQIDATGTDTASASVSQSIVVSGALNSPAAVSGAVDLTLSQSGHTSTDSGALAGGNLVFNGGLHQYTYTWSPSLGTIDIVIAANSSITVDYTLTTSVSGTYTAGIHNGDAAGAYVGDPVSYTNAPGDLLTFSALVPVGAPEPASVAVLLFGIAGIATARRRRPGT